MASANIFALLGEDGEAPAAPVVAKTETAVKKPAGNGKAPAAAANNAKSSNNNRGPRSAGQDGARSGGRGGRGGGGPKAFEGDDQSFDSRGAGRGRGAGKGGGRGPRRDGDEGERRPRREFDRHVSRSGFGRDSGEKRGANGKGNWGNDGENNEAVVPRGDDAADDTVEKEAEAEPEEEKERTLAEFEIAQAEARAALNKVVEVKRVDDAAFQKMTLMKRAEAEDAGLTTSKTKNGKKKANKELKVQDTIDSGIRYKDTSTDRFERDGGKGFGGKGKGGGKGGKGGRDSFAGGKGGFAGGKGGGRGSAGMAAKIEDASAFPTLGGK